MKGNSKLLSECELSADAIQASPSGRPRPRGDRRVQRRRRTWSTPAPGPPEPKIRDRPGRLRRLLSDPRRRGSGPHARPGLRRNDPRPEGRRRISIPSSRVVLGARIRLPGRERDPSKARGLDLPESADRPRRGIARARCPTTVIEEAWNARYRQKYSKQINGPRLFGDLANDHARWPSLLERLPCLGEIVRTLVAL